MRGSYGTSLNTLLIAMFAVVSLIAATVGVAHAQDAGDDGTPLPESAPPEIDDPPSDAELDDLQFIADQEGISLQEAIDRYAWHDNFSLTTSRIREADPEAFAGAEITGDSHAWIAFKEDPPQAALDILDIFRNSHSGISVEVRTGLGYSEAELQKAIPAVHYAVLRSPGVRNASTSFESSTSQIRAVVALELTASPFILDDLRAIATQRLIDETRPDILDTISVSVVRSPFPMLGGVDSTTENLVGGVVTVGVMLIGLLALVVCFLAWLLFLRRGACGGVVLRGESDGIGSSRHPVGSLRLRLIPQPSSFF